MKKTDASKITLVAEPRTVVGKQVKSLRRQGMVPANIYGPDMKSMAITITMKDLMSAYKIAHETGIIYIEVDKQSVPTLIKHLQVHPLSRTVIHVDFRKINLKEKIETSVPVSFTGSSDAVDVEGAILLTQSDHLTIEALPQDIPQTIEIDISQLKAVGDEIKVQDLAAVSGYTIKDEPEKVIVSAVAHKEESTEVQAAPTGEPEIISEKPSEGEESAEEAENKE